MYRHLQKFIFAILLLVLSLEFIAILQIPDKNFHIFACNVGQGDATLLIYKNYQVLVDGGPDKKVLDCLSKYMPFYDRKLELVVLTHPDKDHFMGLIDVFKRYKVENYLYNPITISTQEYKVLEKLVGGAGTNPIYPSVGQVVRLGMIQLDTLAPLEQFSNLNLQFTNKTEIKDSDTNSFSIVSLVSFGKFMALLTGDMTPEVSDRLTRIIPVSSIDYIKIPHHGSKNGLTQNLLEILRPGIATISVGKNNYGHPSTEVLTMLKNLGIKYYRTDEAGDIEVISDGEKFWLRGKTM